MEEKLKDELNSIKMFVFLIAYPFFIKVYHIFSFNGLSLSRMPTVVVHGVVDNLLEQREPIDRHSLIFCSFQIILNFNFRCFLSKVCRQMRDVIYSKDLGFKKVGVHFNMYYLSLCLDNVSFTYKNDESGCNAKCDGRQDELIKKDKLNSFLDDFAIVMKNRKLRLDEFEISGNTFISSERIETLETGVVEWMKKNSIMEKQFKTKKVRLAEVKSDYVIDILSLFKPGVLEKIEINWKKWPASYFDDIDALFELDQWKQANVNWLASSTISNFSFKININFK